MKIVFLNRYQNIVERGAEVFVKELARRLSAKYQVEILEGENADSIKRVLEGRYDIVIPVNGKLQSLKASLARLIGKFKLLITGHSGIGRDDIWNILVKPDVFVSLTDYQKEWAKKWAWGSKVVKIPNGVDLDKFKPEGEKIKIDLPRPIILSVGALVWYKYHDRVIDAVSKIGIGSLLIVGEGPLREKLKKRGGEKLGERFKIASFKYEDMAKVYRSSDLFTLPSWDREAFGIVYLEALASGIGIVAPNDSSRREIIGAAGILVNAADVDKYSKVIEEALGIDWSKKARQQAEKFSWEIIAQKYEKVMLDL